MGNRKKESLVSLLSQKKHAHRKNNMNNDEGEGKLALIIIAKRREKKKRENLIRIVKTRGKKSAGCIGRKEDISRGPICFVFPLITNALDRAGAAEFMCVNIQTTADKKQANQRERMKG